MNLAAVTNFSASLKQEIEEFYWRAVDDDYRRRFELMITRIACEAAANHEASEKQKNKRWQKKFRDLYEERKSHLEEA